MFNTCRSFRLSPNCHVSKILSCKGKGTQIIVMTFVTICVYIISLTFVKMLSKIPYANVRIQNHNTIEDFFKINSNVVLNSQLMSTTILKFLHTINLDA
jgi:hypothetical protein